MKYKPFKMVDCVLASCLKKKMKLEALSDDEMKSFPIDHPDAFAVIKSAYKLLMFGTDGTHQSYQNVLVPLQITACNAFENKNFTDCQCSVRQLNGGIRFFDISRKGIDVLFNYLKETRIPSGSTEKMALRKLLTFFAKKLDAVLSSAIEAEDEAETCLFFMNHLVSRLSISDGWRMDTGTIRRKSYLRCPCQTIDCPIKEPSAEYFADLSIGNNDVWHGCLDAMTLNELPVVLVGEGEGDYEDSDCCGLEFKDSAFRSKDQMYGETIVYSFLQAMNDSGVSFIPILGVKKDAIRVSMYDVGLDVLLTTPENKFLGVIEKYSFMAYIMVWLTCNFKQFFTSPTEQAKEIFKGKQADFRRFAGEKLSVYQGHLHFQKARRKMNEKELGTPDKHSVTVPPECYQV